MSATTEPRRGARVIPVPPPLYYLAGLAGGAALNTALPLPLGARPATAIAGAVIAAAGAAFTLAGVRAVIRHRTTIVPHHPVTALVTGGPYAVSRNPMYTGLAVAYLGVALLLGSWWPLALGPLVIVAVRNLVIRPEEQYLAARFGPAYADYRSRVRRWI